MAKALRHKRGGMKPLIISAILLCVTTSTANAQDVDAGALARSARQSLWSMSDPDVRNVVRPDGQGGVVNAGLGQGSNINIRIPSRRRPAKGRPNNVGSNAKVGSESFFERRRREREEAAAEAARREAERRERIRREDAEDFARGYSIHQGMMSGFYMRKAARDRYLATEGAARLDANVHAMDLATIPTQEAKPSLDTKSNDELAELFEEPVRIIYLDKERSARTSFASGEDISVQGNLDISPQSYNDWLTAFRSTPAVKMPSASPGRITAEMRLLLSAEQCDIDTLPRFVIPNIGLAVCFGDTLLSINKDMARRFTWTSGHVDHVVPCGNSMICKIGQKIVSYHGAKREELFTIDTPEYSLFPKDNEEFWVLAWYADISALYAVNPTKHTMTEVARLPEFIWKVEQSINATYIAIDTKIYQLQKDKKPTLLYNHDKRINDFILTTEGMLLALDDGLVLLSPDYTASCVSDHGILELWADGDDYYAFDTKHNIQYVTFKKTK